MVESVAERGYNAVTVAALSSHAGVSTRDFYKHFGSKEECFLATYDSIVSRAVAGILAAVENEEKWCERLRLGFLAFAGQIAKYFSNAIREDTILRACRGGIVFAAGRAGTVQEAFQAATRSPTFSWQAARRPSVPIAGSRSSLSESASHASL